MNIYKARKLQAILFKRSNAGFKRMRTITSEGKLYYMVWHHICREPSVVISEGVMKIVSDNIGVEVETSIEFINKDINPRAPEGMYVAESIDID